MFIMKLRFPTVMDINGLLTVNDSMKHKERLSAKDATPSLGHLHVARLAPHGITKVQGTWHQGSTRGDPIIGCALDAYWMRSACEDLRTLIQPEDHLGTLNEIIATNEKPSIRNHKKA